MILFAIRLVVRNALPKDAAMTIMEKGVGVSGLTIRRWADGYPGPVAAFAKDPEIKGGDAVSVDEKHYRSRGKARWMARAMCMATRFILVGDHWPDKMNHDTAPLWRRSWNGWEGRPCCCSATGCGGTGRGTATRWEPNPGIFKSIKTNLTDH